jgi:hypothetical protein
MTNPGSIDEYLRRLSPLSRSSLLTELERLKLCGAEIPGTATILEMLRAEFRQSAQASNNVADPSSFFFAVLEPVLIDGAPNHTNAGRVLRGSLAPIWLWISRDLLPTMTRDYIEKIKPLIAADKQREARQVAVAFQGKVAKALENALAAPEVAEQARLKLATYTASQAAYADLNKLMRVLRARGCLDRLAKELPTSILKFDDTRVAKVYDLLDALAKENTDAIEFALTLVANRLTLPWQLFQLATTAAQSKKVADIAVTPYAMTVSMVLDRIEDQRSTLRLALGKNRILVAKNILASIYDAEHALHAGIEDLDRSEWGARLDQLINEVIDLVQAEVERFPSNVGHVLGSASRRRHSSLVGRLTSLGSKGRDIITSGATFCKRLIGEDV